MIEREVREGRGQLWRPSRRPLKEEWRDRVVELVGEPGDVVFFHPWLLHAARAEPPQRSALHVHAVGNDYRASTVRASIRRAVQCCSD